MHQGERTSSSPRWHTNFDTYERILEDDVKKNAVEVAWSVYRLAMRDDLLPRFKAAEMPSPPPAPSPSPTPTPATPRRQSARPE